jgi:hypothetical protein
VATGWGFGTVSSSLLALPAPGAAHRKPVWRFALAWPERRPYERVPL